MEPSTPKKTSSAVRRSVAPRDGAKRKLVSQVELLRVRVAAAEVTWKKAKEHASQAKRRRKLLMHRREMNKFAAQALEKGNTLVPLKMYFKEGRAKVLLGVCRGKQQHDKRQALKQRDSKREIDRAMRRK